jgi:hypothetical protein
MTVVSEQVFVQNTGRLLDLSAPIRGDLDVVVARPLDRSMVRVAETGLYRVTVLVRVQHIAGGSQTSLIVSTADQFFSENVPVQIQTLTHDRDIDYWHNVTAVIEIEAGRQVGATFSVQSADSLVTVDSGILLIEKLD